MASIKNMKIYKKNNPLKMLSFLWIIFLKKLEMLKYTENSN